jgi:hypothetical protein
VSTLSQRSPGSDLVTTTRRAPLGLCTCGQGLWRRAEDLGDAGVGAGAGGPPHKLRIAR